MRVCDGVSVHREMQIAYCSACMYKYIVSRFSCTMCGITGIDSLSLSLPLPLSLSLSLPPSLYPSPSLHRKKLSKFVQHPDWNNASNYVAKCYMKEAPRDVYFEDVKLQMDSKLWGERYNRLTIPKKVCSNITSTTQSSHSLKILS